MSEVKVTEKLNSLIKSLYKETGDIKKTGIRLAEIYRLQGITEPKLAAATALACYALGDASKDAVCDLTERLYNKIFVTVH